MPNTVQPVAIFFRRLTRGDLWNVDRPQNAGPVGGGGQGYFDIPLGNLPVQRLWEFTGSAATNPQQPATWPTKVIQAAAIGQPSQLGALEFASRGSANGRYRIANQNPNLAGGRRHPAWTSARGFPSAPAGAAGAHDIPEAVERIRIYVVRTSDGRYFADFVDGDQMPATWPAGFGLETLFSGDAAGVTSLVAGPDLPPLALRILDGWRRKKNVLLYGPSGTGKTHAMEALWHALQGNVSIRGLRFDPSSRLRPFVAIDTALNLPTPTRREWLTFHQNYGYENFIIGVRPQHSSGGLHLVPRAGVLLDLLIDISSQAVASAVVFVDEINRGNVSRIFGEFITFMDADYRGTIGGTPNPRALPVPLAGVRAETKSGYQVSEPIERPNGSAVRMRIPIVFPEHVYTVASMNSVDRAVAPLDTALARRFVRIEVPPDLEALAVQLGINEVATLADRLEATVANADGADAPSAVASAQPAPPPGDAAQPNAFTAAELAWLLLRRLNFEMASLLGPDFEIGHLYFLPIALAPTEPEKLATLARIWDEDLYPQLRERLLTRPNELLRILRLPDQVGRPYLLRERSAPPASAGTGSRQSVPASARLADFVDSRPADLLYTLRRLAGA